MFTDALSPVALARGGRIEGRFAITARPLRFGWSLGLALGAMEEVLGWKLSVCSVRAVRFARSSRLGGGFRRSPCPGFLGSAQGSYELPGSLGNFVRELKPTRASSSSRGPASKKARGNGPGFLGIARGVWGPTSRKCLVGLFGGLGGLFGRPAGVWGRLGGLGGSWASWTRLGASWRRLGASGHVSGGVRARTSWGVPRGLMNCPGA